MFQLEVSIEAYNVYSILSLHLTRYFRALNLDKDWIGNLMHTTFISEYFLLTVSLILCSNLTKPVKCLSLRKPVVSNDGKINNITKLYFELFKLSMNM